MQKNNKDGYTLGLLVLMVSLFFNLLTLPAVSAADLNNPTNTEDLIETNEDTIMVPFERGSCEQLVRQGLLSPRNCGYTQGKPKDGQIWLTPAQAECVFKFYEGSLTNIISVPTGFGGGVVFAYTLWSTFSACKGL